MRYTVTWTAAAENQLAAVWLAAADRHAVNLASRRLDVLLTDQPETLGDELFDTVRTVAYGPLGVEFEVIPDDLRVVVLAAWDATRGRPGPTGH